MMPPIHKLIGKTIWVSIPAAFEDGRCRAYKLRGVEMLGIWLESEELTGRMLPEDKKQHADEVVVFVPFAQIAGVLAPAPGKALLLTPSALKTPAGTSTAKTPAGHKQTAGKPDHAAGGHTKSK